ncbi:MAG: hypothetical protein JST78_12000 [Bacteroidetes bacterium]|nr:hypothetical protein [Bacteroidota bacterium]
MKLCFKLSNYTRNWFDFFLLLLFFSIAIILFKYKNQNSGISIFFVLIIINFVFTFYLTIVYSLKNINEEFLIEKDKIIRIKKGVIETFNSADISKIVICKSANQDKWGIPYTTFETFRLAKIYLKSGEIIILTNLLEYDIEKPLKRIENVKFERRKGFSFFI